jgi:transcription elongation factor GreA
MPSIRLTPEGAAHLESELTHLKQVRRQEMADRIKMERDQAHGEFAESRTYEDAKSEWALVEGRIAELERLLGNVELLTAAPDRSHVALGAEVEVRTSDDEVETYLIVDPAEANPRQGRISHRSPVGQALLGRRLGEGVGVETPSGMRQLTILAIR